MKIAVRVKPGAKRQAITVEPDGSLVVAVAAPPTDGRANEALREALAAHFGMPKRRVVIRHGAASRRKTIEILG